jgi:predicted membrane protein
MPQLIRPTEKTTIITQTKNGECRVNITLDLNINLNSDGVASVSVGKVAQQHEDENVKWEIGDFSPKKKVKFGKEVKE